MRIRIDGVLYRVVNYFPGSDIPSVRVTDGVEEILFILAESQEAAGRAERAHYEEQMDLEPEFFCQLVGFRAVVNWAQGFRAGIGGEDFDSLDSWLDYIEQNPQDKYAVDGRILKVDRIGRLVDELGFVPTIAYRQTPHKNTAYGRALQQGKR